PPSLTEFSVYLKISQNDHVRRPPPSASVHHGRVKPGPETTPLAGIADRFTDPGGLPLLVASNWIESTPGQHWQHHHHPDHELLWGVDGTVVADVGGERFTVPPRQALWIPNGRDHEVHNVSATQIICTWLSS